MSDTLGMRRLARGLLLVWALPLPSQALPRAAPGPGDPADALRASRLWTTAEGLPQNSINDLHQTPDGALWIATFGGLLRFDGVRFQPLATHDPGLAPLRITALDGDGAGGLWFVTQAGELAHVEGERLVELIAAPPGVEDALGVASLGDVRLVQFVSGALWRHGDGVWRELVPAGLGFGGYGCLVSGRDQFFTIRGGLGLLAIRPSGEIRELAVASSPIESLAVDGDRVWLGLRLGLARFEAGQLETLDLGPGLPRPVRAVLPRGGDSAWLGTRQGVFTCSGSPSGGPWSVVQGTREGPQPFNVRCLLRDREGNLWAGSQAQGLLRITREQVTLHGGGTDRGVSALARDGAGGAWIARACFGMLHVGSSVDASSGPPPETSIPGIGPTACVTALLLDSRRWLWIGVRESLVRWRDGEFAAALPDPRLARRILALEETRGGDVWVASEGGHCLRIDAEDRVVESLTLDRNVICMEPAEDGGLWIGATGALIRARGAETSVFGSEAGIPACDLRALRIDPAGGLWIATYGGGLVHFDGAQARCISREQGLPDVSLSHIEADDRDRLWILANRGLIVAERAQLLEIVQGRRHRVDPVLIGPESGVPEGNSGAPAGLRDELSRLWFGTIGGAVTLDPNAFPFNRTPPTVQIDGLRVDDQPTESRAGRLEVGPLPDRLVFEYTAFALTAPERVRFRYRLDGHDEAWIEGGAERRAAYTRLRPGPYTFRVSARNEDGVWSEGEATVRFDVVAAWWQTGVARGAALLALGGLLFAAHRGRVRAVERRARTLLEATEGRARAEENASRLRDELAHVARVAAAGELATSLAHEVNQPLATIVTTAGAARRVLARETLDRETLDGLLRDIAAEGQRTADIIRRLRAFLQKHASERVPLDVSEVVRDTMPLLERDLRDHAVAIELDLAASLPPALVDRVQLQQVLVNLMRNACEALEDWRGERRVIVRSSISDGRVCLSVSDSGPGIAPEIADRLFEPYVTTKATGMGLGLAICRSIVEAHGGRMALSGETAGLTTIRVEFPHST